MYSTGNLSMSQKPYLRVTVNQPLRWYVHLSMLCGTRRDGRDRPTTTNRVTTTLTRDEWETGPIPMPPYILDQYARLAEREVDTRNQWTCRLECGFERAKVDPFFKAVILQQAIRGKYG